MRQLEFSSSSLFLQMFLLGLEISMTICVTLRLTNCDAQVLPQTGPESRKGLFDCVLC